MSGDYAPAIEALERELAGVLARADGLRGAIAVLQDAPALGGGMAEAQSPAPDLSDLPDTVVEQLVDLPGLAEERAARGLARPGRPKGRAPKDEHDDDIVAAYVAGEPMAAIAARFGVGLSTIRRRVKAAGVPVRDTARPAAAKPPGNPRRAAAIVAAYRDGKTATAVAEQFGIAAHQVYHVLEREGVPRRARGGDLGGRKKQIVRAEIAEKHGGAEGPSAPRAEPVPPAVEPSAPLQDQGAAPPAEPLPVSVPVNGFGLMRARDSAAAIDLPADDDEPDEDLNAEFNAALSRVRANRRAAGPKPRPNYAKTAEAFKRKSVVRAEQAAKVPTLRADGREECRFCGIPGWKGCEHWLPCEAAGPAPVAPEPKPDGRKHNTFTGLRRGKSVLRI